MTLTLRDWTTGDSPLHRMDARWKVLGILTAAVGLVLSQNWGVAALGLLSSTLWLRYAGLPWGWLGQRLGGLGGFLLAVTLLLPVSIPGEPGWALGPIWISRRGLELALLIVVRALAVGGLALLLLATTPLDRLTRALLGLHVPNVLVQLFSMSLRYVYLLGEELGRVRLALRTRAYRRQFSRHSYLTAACVTGNLVVRSQERAERVAQAMRCRGFTGQLRLLPTASSQPGSIGLASLLVASVWLLPWLAITAWQRM